MTGHGFDRHLLGLRLLLRPLHDEAADLFNDALFEQSSTWKLSTSGLSAGPLFKGTGFGAVYPDGYGINCKTLAFVVILPLKFVKDLAAPETIKFGIESKFSCSSTSTELFKYAIESALDDMQAICQSVTIEGSAEKKYNMSRL